MPSGHKKAVTRQIHRRYGAEWDVKIVPVGVELRRAVSSELVRHVCFNFVRDDLIGLRIQPGLGITLPVVNAARDAISPRHEHTVDVITGFVFLNDLIESDARQNSGWLFEAGIQLQPALDNFLAFVDATIRDSGFFESLLTVDDYIEAVDAKRWAFLGVMPTYLYALIGKGELATAKKLANEHRTKSIQIAKDRGFVQRPADTQPYDQILAIPE